MWTKHTSGDGRLFYYDSETKVSTWMIPDELRKGKKKIKAKKFDSSIPPPQQDDLGNGDSLQRKYWDLSARFEGVLDEKKKEEMLLRQREKECFQAVQVP